MIHVLDLSAEIPHDQALYSAETTDMAKDMLSSAGHMMDHQTDSLTDEVTAGIGAIVATGGGSERLSGDALHAPGQGRACWRNGGVDKRRSDNATHDHLRS